MDNSVIDVLQQILKILTADISPSTIVAIIGIVFSSCIALFLTWFSIKLLIKFIINALNGDLICSLNSFKARRWYKKEGYKNYSSYEEYREHYNSKYGMDLGFIK